MTYTLPTPKTRMWAVGSSYYKQDSLSLRTNRHRSFPRFVALAIREGVFLRTNARTTPKDSLNFRIKLKHHAKFLSLPFLFSWNLSDFSFRTDHQFCVPPILLSSRWSLTRGFSFSAFFNRDSTRGYLLSILPQESLRRRLFLYQRRFERYVIC